MAELCLVSETNINSSWLQETYLKQGIRLDERKFTQKRNIEHQIISSSEDHIVIKVTMGYTIAICSLSAKRVCPYPDRPEEGFFRVTSVQGTENISRKWIHILCIMEQIEYLNRKKKILLCIVPNSLVWSVEASMTIVNDDGSVLDALFMALTLASKSFSLFNKCGIVISTLCTSFALCKKDPKFLIDPTLIEEQLTGNNILTICVDLDRKVCTNIYYNYGGKLKDNIDISCILDQCIDCTRQ